MTLSVKHSTTATLADQPGVEINKAEWNANHTLVGTVSDAQLGLTTPALGTPSALVGTNITGTAAGLTAGNATTAATVTTNANLTGPVTSVGNATTITDAAVTLAKMADLAQDTFIIRTTASTGVPQTATMTAAARTVNDDATVAAMVDTLGGAASTGTGGLVRKTDAILVTPNLGTPSAGVLTNATGLPLGSIVAGSNVSIPALTDQLHGVGGEFLLSRSLGLLGIGCTGLLTLASGIADYRPEQYKAIPASTDTTAETVTFTNPHGWTVGTMVTTDVTVGGLTLGTIYYVIVASTTAISFATTLANAVAGTKINLTASITGNIIGFGIQGKTLYLTPWFGAMARISDGTRVNDYALAEVSLAITATSGSIYDVWLRDASGTLTLDTTVWTSFGAGTSQRATALDFSNGWPVKSGDATRLYVGSFMAVATDTLEDSCGYAAPFNAGVTANENHGKRFLWSAAGHSRIRSLMNYCGTSHTGPAPSAWAQWNGGTVPTYCAEYLSGLPAHMHVSMLVQFGTGATVGNYAIAGIRFNAGTTATPEYESFINCPVAAAALDFAGSCGGVRTLPAGYNYVGAGERSINNAATFANMYMSLAVNG